MSALLNILVIATAHTALGTTGGTTGVWLEELTTPYYVFKDAGVSVDVATLNGGVIPVDPHSVGPKGKNPASVERFMAEGKDKSILQNALSLEAVKNKKYDAVFIPGGHGAMWDLAESRELGSYLTKVWSEGYVVSSVCHGPASLSLALGTDGKPLVAGKKVSSFSNAEEAAAGLTDKMPFALETRLRSLGANYVSGPNFGSFAVRDGRLVTGQNPASSEAVAKLVLEALKDR